MAGAPSRLRAHHGHDRFPPAPACRARSIPAAPVCRAALRGVHGDARPPVGGESPFTAGPAGSLRRRNVKKQRRASHRLTLCRPSRPNVKQPRARWRYLTFVRSERPVHAVSNEVLECHSVEGRPAWRPPSEDSGLAPDPGRPGARSRHRHDRFPRRIGGQGSVPAPNHCRLAPAHPGVVVGSDASYAAALRGSMWVNWVAKAIVDGPDLGLT